MGKASKTGAPQVEEGPGFEGRYTQVDEYTIGFEAYSEHMDAAPLFVGLPDDRCQAPHWGYVIKGKLAYHYGDGTTDEITAGEAYYARPGHTPEMFPDTEVVEFSPTESLNQTMEVVMKNIANMG